VKNKKPTRSKLTVLNQLCKYIPEYLVPKIARKYQINKQARSFTAWSHVVSMLFAQLSHSFGLNDVCDTLKHHQGVLSSIRGAFAPSKNALSHANKIRDSNLAKDLFWETLKHLQTTHPKFGMGQNFKGFPRRFKKVINVVDSTTIKLVANCMDWAKHRRRKAAAKCHMRLDLKTFLPKFAIVGPAKDADDKRAREICADVQDGEIVVFDRAYVDFEHLFDLESRGVSWVTRAKRNMSYRVVKECQKQSTNTILRDDLILLKPKKSKKNYSKKLRRVEAKVEIDGKEMIMVFITNNLDWAPSSVCDLYKSRWQIEIFFKQIKQTLKLCDFLGHSSNAVHWQIWSALLLYVLLRYQAYLSKWNHSFMRLFGLIRGIIWDRFDLQDLLKFYGTAGRLFKWRPPPLQPYLPGFSDT